MQNELLAVLIEVIDQFLGRKADDGYDRPPVPVTNEET
jgi:hypothetical protein